MEKTWETGREEGGEKKRNQVRHGDETDTADVKERKRKKKEERKPEKENKKKEKAAHQFPPPLLAQTFTRVTERGEDGLDSDK